MLKLTLEKDEICARPPRLVAYDDPDGIEVPDAVAKRWLKVYRDFYKVLDEISDFLDFNKLPEK